MSLAAVLAACGGGGNSSAVDTSLMPVAFQVLGQPDFISKNSNRGMPTNALGLAQPLGGIATDGEHFYIADYGNNRILGWNTIPSGPSVEPDFVIGQSDFTGNQPGTSATSLALPSSVQVANGKLVVADSGNNRVLIWNSLPTGNTAPDVVVGQTSFASSVSPTPPSADSLSFPVSASIANGKLFVSDQNNNRVLIWNTVPTSNGAPADVVLGQRSTNTSTDTILNTDQSLTTSLATPAGLWTDGVTLLVADSGNNRVLKFGSFPIASGAAAIEVFGQNTFTARIPNDDNQDGTTDLTPSARTMSSPTGVSFFNGVLYVTDRNNHRILLFPG